MQHNVSMDNPVMALAFERFFCTLVPELISVLGPEGFVKFSTVFGGRTIEVPDVSELWDLTVDAHIYSELRDEVTKDKVEWLAANYDLDVDEVRGRFVAAKSTLEVFDTALDKLEAAYAS